MKAHYELHWIDGPWAGSLAVAPRPRGGDWLNVDLAAWRDLNVDTVVSLLEPDEAAQLDLAAEPAACSLYNIDYLSFPIEDRGVPCSFLSAVNLLHDLEQRLANGQHVVVHCRQGVGRAGMIAAGLFIRQGSSVHKAFKSSVRRGEFGCRKPESNLPGSITWQPAPVLFV